MPRHAKVLSPFLHSIFDIVKEGYVEKPNNEIITAAEQAYPRLDRNAKLYLNVVINQYVEAKILHTFGTRLNDVLKLGEEFVRQIDAMLAFGDKCFPIQRVPWSGEDFDLPPQSYDVYFAPSITRLLFSALSNENSYDELTRRPEHIFFYLEALKKRIGVLLDDLPEWFTHDARSAEEDLIASLDEWAREFGLNRNNKESSAERARSPFQELVLSILKKADEYLVILAKMLRSADKRELSVDLAVLTETELFAKHPNGVFIQRPPSDRGLSQLIDTARAAKNRRPRRN